MKREPFSEVRPGEIATFRLRRTPLESQSTRSQPARQGQGRGGSPPPAARIATTATSSTATSYAAPR